MLFIISLKITKNKEIRNNSIMIQESISHKFAALPPEAQQQLIDFMDFLTTKYSSSIHNENFNPSDELFNEAFIGMWQNREDMQDSSAWVRNLRNNEWALKYD
jgi:hypothetical protein